MMRASKPSPSSLRAQWCTQQRPGAGLQGQQAHRCQLHTPFNKLVMLELPIGDNFSSIVHSVNLDQFFAKSTPARVISLMGLLIQKVVD